MVTTADRSLVSLIGSISDRALDPVRWPAALADLAAEMGLAAAQVALVDLESDAMAMVHTFGIGRHWLERQAEHWPGLTRWLTSRQMAAWPQDRLLSMCDAAHAGITAVQQFRREWLRPQGFDPWSALIVLRTRERLGLLGMGCKRGKAPISSAVASRLTMLLPHIRRSVAINAELGHLASDRATLVSMLDSITIPTVAVTARGRILQANIAGHKMLERRYPLRRNAGILAAAHTAVTKEFAAALAAAPDDGLAVPAGGHGLRISRPGETAFVAHVLPLTVGDAKRGGGKQAHAVVFVCTADRSDRGIAQTFAEVFHLTGAETRLLQRLSSGRSLKEAASDLGVASTTARSHLTQIFNKTGVSRQSDLIAMMHQLTPPVSNPNVGRLK